jgi:Flp pilus assembly protein TadD
MEQGELDRAVSQFREVLAVDPQSATAQRFLGKALLKKGDARGAVSAYRKAVDLRPDDGHVRYELALALDADGKRSDAINELRKLSDASSQRSEGDGVRGLGEATLRRWSARP